MSKTDFIKRLITELHPEDRATIDDFLVQQLAADVTDKRQQQEFTIASDYLDAASELKRNWGKMQGLSSGYPTLDRLMLGLVPGELTVIAGATSEGKTALSVNIASHILRGEHNVLFVTLEMTKEQLVSRFMFLDDNFIEYSARLGLQVSDELDWQSVDGLIAGAVEQLGVELVIIDHLHYFSRAVERLAEDLGRITKEFKKNAQRHKVPVILISHVRKTERGKRPSIDDLRGSSYIGQDADIVLMVSRDKAYPTKISVQCEKNRNRGIADFEPQVMVWDKTRITEPWR